MKAEPRCTSTNESGPVWFEVNLGGLIVGSLLAISRMGVRGGGQGGTILNTASLAGILTGAFNTPVEEVYTATKQAVTGWTRSLGEKNSVWTEDRVRSQSSPESLYQDPTLNR